MARVLITDVDSALGFQLVKQHLNAGDQVITTTQDQRATSRFPDNEGDTLLTVYWSAHTPLASRNLLMSAMNFMEGLDHSLILQAPQVTRALVHEVQFFDIEAAVDTWIKGYVFLVKHILAHHLERRNPQGVVALLVDQRDEPEAADPPLAQMINAAFAGLARGVVDSYSVAGLAVLGFQWRAGRPEEFAQFAMKTIAQPAAANGGWHRFGRTSLLASLARPRFSRRP